MQLAQLNIAEPKYDLTAPEMRGFVDNLDAINSLAESSPGFVWRMQDEHGDATNIQAFDDPRIIVNMSVWRDLDSLKNFLFKTHHRDFMRRKSEWFNKLSEASYVLWWVPDNHIPSLDEAKSKLDSLRTSGESSLAFSFKQPVNAIDL